MNRKFNDNDPNTIISFVVSFYRTSATTTNSMTPEYNKINLRKTPIATVTIWTITTATTIASITTITTTAITKLPTYIKQQ